MKVWEERRVFGHSGSKTLHELIEEAEGAQAGKSTKSRPTSASEAGKTTTATAAGPSLPPSLAGAVNLAHGADTATAHSAELAGTAEAIDIETAAASDEASTARQTLEQYISALQSQISQLDATKAALLTAAEGYSDAASQAMQTLQEYEARLAAFDHAHAAAPTALVPEPEAGPGGVEDTVDAAEAAALATQLMQNPQALIDAIAATMPLLGGGGGGTAGTAEEYDPENMW